MSRRSKLTDEERIQIVEEYLDVKDGYKAISSKYGINKTTLRDLMQLAKAKGIEYIKISVNNQHYSKTTKEQAVEEYLNGKGSQYEICAKYEIKCRKTLRKWILCYNNGKNFKERTRSERGITMNKGRKTTQEERAEIVAFCIENGKDYGLAMEKYGVSYQKVYSWVRKYEAKGIEGLSDRRGKAKPENELTVADRLRMENKILQVKFKDMEMENKLLKNSKNWKGAITDRSA